MTLPSPLGRAAPGAHAGVVQTPAALARRLARLLPPGTERLLDPACGDGALLVAALAEGRATPAGVFGIEIDAASAQRARGALATQAGSEHAGSAHDARAESIRHTDALANACEWPVQTWVIANPPWLSFSGRHASRRRELLPTDLPAGWPSLQSAFVVRIARHVFEQGTGAVLLLPTSLLDLERYGTVRSEATRYCQLSAPIELGEDAFEGVTEPSVIVRLDARSELAAGSSSSWLARSWLAAALERHFEPYPRLPEGSFRDPGVHTGNSAALLVSPNDGTRAALRQGRDLAAYRLAAASLQLRTDLERTPERRFRVAALEHYRSFGVLIRQTAHRPMAALHTQASYFRNSLLACNDVAGLDAAFVVAVLNHPVAALWHRSLFADARQRTFPQVKVRHLRSQPFPFVARAVAPELHDEIVARVRAVASAGDAGAGDAAGDVNAIEELVFACFSLRVRLTPELLAAFATPASVSE